MTTAHDGEGCVGHPRSILGTVWFIALFDGVVASVSNRASTFLFMRLT